MNQSELEAIKVTDVKRGKTRATKPQWVLFLLLIGRESGARFLTNHSKVKQNLKLATLQGLF